MTYTRSKMKNFFIKNSVLCEQSFTVKNLRSSTSPGQLYAVFRTDGTIRRFFKNTIFFIKNFRYVHRDNPDVMPKANLVLFSKEISEWNDRCFPGWINRRLPTAAIEDFNRCRLCEIEVRQTSRHIAEAHLMIALHQVKNHIKLEIKIFQCPLCEYGAAESRLVRRHMKNNHKKKDIKGLDPIANVVEHRAEFSALHDQCFPGRPKRLSNITISEEGRRAKCKQCGLTISKKRRLIHLLEKHLKKPVFR